nr:MazG-like family protein [uncultured Draconibacterium sp.]
MEKVLNEVKAERHRQNEKWGVQDHHPIEWMSILMEEVGEASKEIVDWNFANGINNVKDKVSPDVQEKRLKDYRAECIQIAAVAVQMVESLDRNFEKFNSINVTGEKE